MACFISNRNSCFGPYYPCPISCCSCRCCCANIVQNPSISTINLAFFALTTPTTVASGAVVPMPLVSSVGTSITSTTPGTANLTPGTYEVTYSVTSVIGASGTNSFGLELGGTILPASVTTVTGVVGDTETVSGSAVLTVTATSTLSLNNLGADAVDVNVANMTIRKIS